MLNRPAQLLAVIAAGLTVVYPFIKRFISIPQFVLGAAFGMSVPMAFAAQTGETRQLAWLVFGATLTWAVIYDTFYAMVDRADDLKVGVKSTAILFGDADLFVIGGLQLLMLLALVMIGSMAQLGPWYFSSIGATVLLMAWHQWLARHREPAGWKTSSSPVVSGGISMPMAASLSRMEPAAALRSGSQTVPSGRRPTVRSRSMKQRLSRLRFRQPGCRSTSQALVRLRPNPGSVRSASCSTRRRAMVSGRARIVPIGPSR
jgi:hypothetical protein